MGKKISFWLKPLGWLGGGVLVGFGIWLILIQGISIGYRSVPEALWFPEGMITFGPPDTEVTAVVISDPYCTYCDSFFNKVVEKAQQHHKRIGVRLVGVLQSHSQIVASSLFAAYHQGAYEIFKRHGLERIQDTSSFQRLIEQNIADPKKFFKDMIVFEATWGPENLRLALACGCSDVPLLILRDGRHLTNPKDLENLKWPL